MRPMLNFLVMFSRNPIVLLISIVFVVHIPSVRFDQDWKSYVYMIVVAVPWIIFLASYKYLRKDDDVTTDS